MKRKKTLPQSPIEMVLVSYAKNKTDENRELFLYSICRKLCQHRTNISLTIITNIESIPKNIRSHRRMTIITTNGTWLHYVTSLIHEMSPRVDYCLLTTPRFSPILWWYARILGAKSIYIEQHTRPHIFTNVPRYIASFLSRFVTWSIHHFDLTTRVPKQQIRRSNTTLLAESLYLHIYHHCTLSSYKRPPVLHPSFS